MDPILFLSLSLAGSQSACSHTFNKHSILWSRFSQADFCQSSISLLNKLGIFLKICQTSPNLQSKLNKLLENENVETNETFFYNQNNFKNLDFCIVHNFIPFEWSLSP
jgi:hypothetical protein